MIENNTTSVAAAFEMLIEEIEADIDFVNQQGSKAFEARDYDGARDALEKAAQITAYREKLDAVRREWTQIIGTEESQDEETRSNRRDLGRVRRGLRTPENEYIRPILQTLTDFGGSAPLGDVLERVRQSDAAPRLQINGLIDQTLWRFHLRIR